MQPWDWQNDPHWAGRSALVLGAGESGRACARWLLLRGMRVVLADSRPIPAETRQRLEAIAAEAATTVAFLDSVQEPFSPSLLEGHDLWIPSPGLSPHPDRVHSMSALLGSPCAMASELDLFDWALAQPRLSSDGEGLRSPSVLAITGTNGKTTTAALTAHLLRSAGLRVGLAGNISPAMLEVLCDAEQSGDHPEAWVLELSSFQLSHAQRFSPTAATILNFDEDHLDWHQDHADYLAAKLRVFGLPQARPEVLKVVNLDATGHGLRDAVQALPGKSVEFSLVDAKARWGRQHQGIDWLVRQTPASKTLPDGEVLKLMPAEALRIRGSHNQSNALAALALAEAVPEAPLSGLLHGLRSFMPQAHRWELVATHNHIDFVDDSKGTNVAATLAGLQGMASPLALIAGGDGKGQDFSPLVTLLAKHAQCMVACIGRDGPAIANALSQAGVPHVLCASLPEAVERCAQQADSWRAEGKARATVLLSPACASLDMFKSYVHRAEVFRAAVSELLMAEGQTL